MKPTNRVPGKYIVVGVVLAAVLFVATLAAVTGLLRPAADRFRQGGPVPTRR